MLDLTTIIITKNEEKNIAQCIRSVQGISKRIIMIDSYSEDQTTTIANDLGAEIYYNVFTTHAAQIKYGLENTEINTQWIFRIDADERLTEESANELERVCRENENTDVNGIIVRFEVIFMGKKLKHGGIYPFRKLLVFKRGKAFIEERNMDEHFVLTEGRSVELKNDSQHCDYKDLTYWISKHNWYASKEAEDYFERQSNKENNNKLDKSAKLKRFIKYNIYYKLPMGMRAQLYYIYRYYGKLGFLDGKEGKIFAFMQAYWYRFLVDAKIYEKNQNGEM